MKASVIIFFLIILQFSTAQAQFAETECCLVPHHNYYFENYQVGHFGSYKLFHNGNAIYFQGSIGTYMGMELKFVNDSTGFFVVVYNYAVTSVYSVVGDSVTSLGTEDGFFLSSFVANPQTLYVATETLSSNDSTLIFGMKKFSTVSASAQTITDSVYSSDITVTDTIVGMPLCSGLSELHYCYYVSSFTPDTTCYAVQLFIEDSTFAVFENDLINIELYPNPAEDFVFMNLKNSDENYEIRIYNSLGCIEKSFEPVSDSNAACFIGDLKSGFYIMEISDGKSTRSVKLIKK